MKKVRVLLVEDDPVYQELVTGILEEEGFSICCCIASGEEAGAAVASYDPDVVLMDIALSGELDGIETAAMIRAAHDVPVVYVTAYASPEVIERLKATAPYGFIYKAVTAEQLVATLETALHRHRLDRQVRESNSWLSTVLASISDAVISTDSSGRITYCNRAATELVGPVRIGQTLGSALPLACAADREVIDALLERGLAGGGTIEMEDPIGLETEAADSISVRLTINPLADGHEAVSGAVAVLRDVTSKQRLLEELKSFKLVVDSMQIGVNISDLDRNIRYVNPAEAQMHGYPAEELIGRQTSSLGASKAPGSLPLDVDMLGGWQRSAVNMRKDGSRFPVQLFSDVVRDEQGAPVALVTCSEDMSDRLEAEEQIRKLYRAVDQSPNLVVITDVDGKIEYVNPEFTRVTGFTAEEAIGENPSVLKSGRMDPSVYTGLWQTITHGGTWRGEFLNRRKDGSQYWAIASISGLRDDRGEVRHYVGVQQDITERKMMERELEHKNAELERLNRLKGELVAVTSHDLKSPLHAMVSIASLLKEIGGRLDAKTVAGHVDTIIASGHRLSRFISEILDAEKVESGMLSLDLRPLRVGELLEDCVEVARAEGRGKGLRFVYTCEEKQTTILADASRLRQVFSNILGNAVKFSPQGAEVSVHVADRDQGVEVTISDRGPGIPEKDREAIFDRYYQVTSKGAAAERGFGVGLGLYVTRNLVALHGGTIHAENHGEGRGCRFVVHLPAAISENRPPGLSALVVDPDETIGEWLGEILRIKDVNTSVVSSAAEAESLFRRRRPQIVFAQRVGESPELLAAYAAIASVPGVTTRLVSIEDQKPGPKHSTVGTVLVAPVADTEIFELLRELQIEAAKGAQPR